jgi:hypothetical protein
MSVKWMQDATYLAQVGHALAGYGVLVTTGYFGGLHAVEIVGPLFVLYAAVKEFWFDPKFEKDPPQTAADGALDFTFYMVGALVGFVVVLLYTFLRVHHLVGEVG